MDFRRYGKVDLPSPLGPPDGLLCNLCTLLASAVHSLPAPLAGEGGLRLACAAPLRPALLYTHARAATAGQHKKKKKTFSVHVLPFIFHYSNGNIWVRFMERRSGPVCFAAASRRHCSALRLPSARRSPHGSPPPSVPRGCLADAWSRQGGRCGGAGRGGRTEVSCGLGVAARLLRSFRKWTRGGAGRGLITRTLSWRWGRDAAGGRVYLPYLKASAETLRFNTLRGASEKEESAAPAARAHGGPGRDWAVLPLSRR